jgi:hypothetical protein
MSSRRAVAIVLAVLAFVAWATTVSAQYPGTTTSQTITQIYPGVTWIVRTDSLPWFRCPGCGSSTPNPRLAKMNILVIDLTAPGVHFKLTPPGTNLPAPAQDSAMPNWPVVPYEVVRQHTLTFLGDSHAQAAINVHFFAPFPNPPGASQTAWAYVIGLAASRGSVYSAFESPIQSYAIVTDVPGINIDSANNASVVHKDPAFADNMHVLENVQLWNALAGSGQIVTNGVKTIPNYKNTDHPNELLTAVSPYSYYTTDCCSASSPTCSPCQAEMRGRSWYMLSNARTGIGLTQDNRTLVLFTVDGTNGGHGMKVDEVADLLMRDFNVYNALNLDGGGSVTMALQDPTTQARKVVNVPAENPNGNPPGRSEASSFAVYSDAELPVTTATVTPAPNANGWNKAAVTVALAATDLATGLTGTFPGWVDKLQYFASGAQPLADQTVPGSSTSFGVSAEGVTKVTYFATDAADNKEAAKTLDVNLDFTAPVIAGLPGGDCGLWPPNHKLQQVAVVTATDAGSRVASLVVTGTSSEPPNPKEPDIVFTANGSGGQVVELRSERLGNGPGRVYTLTATATDLLGNVSVATTTCTVAHDQRKK